MARKGEVPVLIERGETLARGFRLRAGWVETDELFVQLLGVWTLCCRSSNSAVSSSSLGLSPLQAARTTQNTTAPMWIHCLIISPITLIVPAIAMGARHLSRRVKRHPAKPLLFLRYNTLPRGPKTMRNVPKRE